MGPQRGIVEVLAGNGLVPLNRVGVDVVCANRAGESPRAPNRSATRSASRVLATPPDHNPAAVWAQADLAHRPRPRASG